MITTQPMNTLLKKWQDAKLITALDRHFALELAEIEHIDAADECYPLFLLICTLLSQQLSNQHSCLVLNNIVLDNPMAEDIGTHPFAIATASSCQIQQSHTELITQISAFNAIGQPGDNTPMIIELDRLYLNKYYFFETK